MIQLLLLWEIELGFPKVKEYRRLKFSETLDFIDKTNSPGNE